MFKKIMEDFNKWLETDVHAEYDKYKLKEQFAKEYGVEEDSEACTMFDMFAQGWLSK